VGYPTKEKPMKGVHGIAGVTGGTLPAQIWHTFMASALQGQPVEQFASPGAPPYKRWCGRYQFARTWRDARKQGGCKHHHHRRHKHRHKTTTHRKTTTAKTTTVHTTTQVTTRSTTTRPTTTAPPPTTTERTTTTEPTTTTGPTTTTTQGPP
jgi:membrane peptidoglycan carboxypeptidase